MPQAIAILIIIALLLLFVKYVLFEGDVGEGVGKAASGCGLVSAAVLGWIAIAAFIIFVIYAALGGFNR